MKVTQMSLHCIVFKFDELMVTALSNCATTESVDGSNLAQCLPFPTGFVP